MLRDFINNEKGSTFMMVMIGLCLVVFLSVALMFTGDTDTKVAIREEQKTQAYYVAKTGAESYVSHLRKGIKAGDDVIQELKDLKGKTSEVSDFNDASGDKVGTFTIKIEEDMEAGVATGKYNVITTGNVKDVESQVVAVVSPEFKGGGYKEGDGKIFINQTSKVEIPKVPQLVGAGVSIYTNGKRHMSGESSIFVSDDTTGSKPIKELFIGVPSGAEVQKPNKAGDYSLEVQETVSGKTTAGTKVTSSDMIKREILMKYKGSVQDTSFEEVEFRYETNKDDVLSYFSKQTLSTKSMTDSQIKEGLKSTFLLPITTVDEYKAYVSGTKVYPDPKSFTAPSGAHKVSFSGLASGSKIDTKDDLKGKKNVHITSGIDINNGGELTMRFSGDTDVYLGEMSIDDTTLKEKINIYADGKVNIYITSDSTWDGELKAILENKNAEVNIYAKCNQISSNNKALVKDINLYAPNTGLQLNKVDWTGIIVAKSIQFKDDATFKAPSAGAASTGAKKSSKIAIEWKK